MKTNIFLILFVMMSLSLFGQIGNIGISTTAPRTTLDVNGTMNVNNEINLGGNDATIGNSGTVGDLFAARADTLAIWKKYDLPAGYLDGLILTASYTKSSTTGVNFIGTANSIGLSIPYSEDQALPANWKEITGVQELAVKVGKVTNVVNVSVQTVAQITGGTGLGSFGCGIYVDDKLKLVRTNNVAGDSGSYRILNFNASIQNLSIGNHTIKFACTERNVSTANTLYIGENQPGSTNLNPQMAGTALSIQVLEPIQ